MQKELILKLRKYLDKQNLDYLLINTNDEFLLEYNELETCARYLVTNFKGSCGEALLSKDALYLFVDGRYHIQADKEVDKDIVTVIKMQSNDTFSKLIAEKIPENKSLGIVSKKTSLKFFQKLKQYLDCKNVEIKPLKEDAVLEYAKVDIKTSQQTLKLIPLKITGKSFEEKITEVRNFLQSDEMCLFTKLEDIAYYTNLRGYTIQNSSVFKGYLIVSHNDATLYTNEKLPQNNINKKSIQYFFTDLKEKTKQYKTIFEPSSINLECYNIIKDNAKEINLTDGQNPFNRKSIKNSSEIAHYKEIYKKTDEVVEYINELVNSNKIYTEFELAQIVKEEFKKRGAIDLSFKTILAFDTNSALIHYTANSKEKNLSDGAFVLLDCGAYFEGGYATDITRTFIRGIPTQEQKRVYTSVLKAFLAGYNYNVTNETTGKDIDKVVRETIKTSEQEGYLFSHSTGHGVGICVHEAPPYLTYSQAGENKLHKNMIFSIEPGLYKEGIGGVRLENIVYINEENKIESLSKAMFEPKLIDFSMLNEKETEQLAKWQTK